MMGWNGGMMSGFSIGMGLIGWLVQLSLFIAVIYLVVTLIKKLNHHSDTNKQGYAILKERFAQGEITEDEYKEMKKILDD
ncbi:SHOCT domain-containing protein [Sporolactobacillus pectinivorans]|uniref:SHOCT domain-containing protein n=1 Tax=Sporolactobacillus pectinivorans TaxID=1591408 RepID=UPI000C268D42|nr:SHOCT domain-containing protein [Sporolactobacillus pectinivorans]